MHVRQVIAPMPTNPIMGLRRKESQAVHSTTEAIRQQYCPPLIGLLLGDEAAARLEGR